MTLLTIVQKAAARAGWENIPSSAISNTSTDALSIQQMIAFAQDGGDDAQERAGWVRLDRSATFTGDGTTTLWTLPADWVRFSPGDKAPYSPLVSSKYPLLPLLGPVNTEELNQLKALPASTVRPVWRIVGTSIELWPAISAGEIITFSYYSSYWILASNGTTRKAEWSVDTDTSLIPERLIQKYILWRWMASKGFDYAEAFRDYEMALPRMAAQQMTERTISTSRDWITSGYGFYGTITDNTTPI